MAFLLNYLCVCGLCDLNMGNKKRLSQETIAQIIALKSAGHQAKEISAMTGVCIRQVHFWVARFREGGSIDTPTHKERGHRPKKTSSRAENILKRDIEKNPRLTARKVKENNPGVFSGVSVRTVSRRLHDLEYRSHRPAKKPLLTRIQKRRRVDFAKKYLVWPNDKWIDVLWSDEATFTVTCNRGAHVYRKPGSDRLDPRYCEQTVKHPDSLMVWGSFGGRGLGSLVVLPKNVKVNQEVYYELLNDHLADSFDSASATLFQQDGAPAHTARSIKQWLVDCGIDYINDWPGNSPDINPIENLWNIIKRKLQDKDVSSVPRLEAAIREAWQSIPLDTLHNLALSVPKRLREVQKRKGKPTKY